MISKKHKSAECSAKISPLSIIICTEGRPTRTDGEDIPWSWLFDFPLHGFPQGQAIN